MTFTPYLELSPPYATATNYSLRDGNVLYLIGGTVLCKYDISNPKSPVLLGMTDVLADHTATEFLQNGTAHATAMVDLGEHLAVSLRNSGGGVANMDDGVLVGNLSIIHKATLEKVGELNFENKVTSLTRYKDLLIVSLHFHGFYIYKIDGTALSCLFKHIEIEKPRGASTIEFQNCAVFEQKPNKIHLAFASYNNGISTFIYDLKENTLTRGGELHPSLFPDTVESLKGAKNTVFGLTAKGNFVYGGLSTGNKRFREQFKDLDWARYDKRGIIYGPHDRLEEEHYQMVLPECDKPLFIGAIAGDPAPSFLCTAEDYLLFNLDKQGLGIAKIGEDGKLTYLGRALEDPDGRQLTYHLHYDGQFLHTSYKVIPEGPLQPVFRMFTVK